MAPNRLLGVGAIEQATPTFTERQRRKATGPMLKDVPKLALPPEVMLGYRLWQVHYSWHRHIERYLKAIDLTHMQYVLLAAIYHLVSQGEAPSQIRLSNFTHVEKMMVSKNLRVLENRGLLSRKPLPEDRRANQIQLTAAGRHMLQRAFAASETAHAKFFHVIGDDWKRVDILLRELIDNQRG